MTVDFKFSIGQKVNIKANDIQGEVKELWVDKTGKHQTNVEYADRNGAIFSRWFSDDEVTDATPEAEEAGE